MNPTERTQLVVMKRLHADADAIDSERSPERDRVLRHILRIRLDRKLCSLLDGKTLAKFVYDADQVLTRGPRRRPAAEEDAVHAFAIRPRLNLGKQCAGVLILQTNVGRNRKRTIRAVNAAEREVDVKTEGHN